MNHTDEPVIVPVEGTNLLSGATWTSTTSLAEGDVAVIRH